VGCHTDSVTALVAASEINRPTAWPVNPPTVHFIEDISKIVGPIYYFIYDFIKILIIKLLEHYRCDSMLAVTPIVYYRQEVEIRKYDSLVVVPAPKPCFYSCKLLANFLSIIIVNNFSKLFVINNILYLRITSSQADMPQQV